MPLPYNYCDTIMLVPCYYHHTTLILSGYYHATIKLLSRNCHATVLCTCHFISFLCYIIVRQITSYYFILLPITSRDLVLLCVICIVTTVFKVFRDISCYIILSYYYHATIMLLSCYYDAPIMLLSCYDLATIIILHVPFCPS